MTYQDTRKSSYFNKINKINNFHLNWKSCIDCIELELELRMLRVECNVENGLHYLSTL